MAISRKEYGMLIKLVKQERINLADDLRRCEMEMNRMSSYPGDPTGIVGRWNRNRERDDDLNALQMKLDNAMNGLPFGEIEK